MRHIPRKDRERLFEKIQMGDGHGASGGKGGITAPDSELGQDGEWNGRELLFISILSIILGVEIAAIY